MEWEKKNMNYISWTTQVCPFRGALTLRYITSRWSEGGPRGAWVPSQLLEPTKTIAYPTDAQSRLRQMFFTVSWDLCAKRATHDVVFLVSLYVQRECKCWGWGPLKGTVLAKKSLQGSESWRPRLGSCWEERKGRVFPWLGLIQASYLLDPSDTWLLATFLHYMPCRLLIPAEINREISFPKQKYAMDLKVKLPRKESNQRARLFARCNCRLWYLWIKVCMQ